MEIKLYIGGYEVELTKEPEILYTFQVDDATNPTVVKNGYSKTIELKGTQRNNEIFGQIWKLDRVQSIDNFNPSKKVEFQLFYGGELYQSGYVKLDSVDRSLDDITYNITLYGGLGDFFYNLMYSSGDTAGDSEQRTLADLQFIPVYDSSGSATTRTPNTQEFDFQINKDTIYSAWTQIESQEDNKWSHINFAPCYNGLPEDFDSDKVLINTKFLTGYTLEQSGYTDYDGYILTTIDKERTEWEIRDLRSYLQRPVVRVRRVIEAICQPYNNGGYEVDLDEKFFNVHNPYWDRTWVTLPMLQNLEYIGSYEGTGATGGSIITGNTKGYALFSMNRCEYSLGMEAKDIDEGADTYNADMVIRVKVGIDTTATTVNYYPTSDMFGYCGGMELQLVAKSAEGKIIGASDNINLTSTYKGGIPTPNDLRWTPLYGDTYTTVVGHFSYDNSKKEWVWSSEISLSIKDVPKNAELVLYCNKVNTDSGPIIDALANALWVHGSVQDVSRKMNDFNVEVLSSDITYNQSENVRTGAKITKQNLLNTEYSPADFLLSYCKMFGLYFKKDPDKKLIHIMTRDTFYDRTKVYDISDSIDWGDSSTMKPMIFDAKWYEWQNEGEGEFWDRYYNSWGVPYGCQKVNTGYNFDGNSKDLYEDTIFKGGIECLEKSDMYSTTTGGTLPWQYGGYSYNLYGTTDDDSIEIKVPSRSRIGQFEPYNTARPFYDLVPKLQFHDTDNDPLDGSGVMVFYNGDSEDIRSYGYWLTDDNSVMGILNEDTPCWLYTESATDTEGNEIGINLPFIPQFGRYMKHNYSDMNTQSLDFGTAREFYIPERTSTTGTNIYDRYWKSYISDLYDVDTREVELSVRPWGQINEDSLRKFYWFDNSIWRIERIIDYNIMSDETFRCVFIKVKDINNYTNINATDIVSYTLSFSPDMLTPVLNIPSSGATVRVYVDVSDDSGSWFLTDSLLDFNPDKTRGYGDGSFTIEIPAFDEYREIDVRVEGGNDEMSNLILIVQQPERLNPYITLDPWNIKAECNSTAFTIGVDSNVKWNVGVITGTNEPYITVTPYEIEVDCEEYSAKLNVNSNIDWKVGLKDNENRNYLYANPNDIMLGCESGETVINVSSNLKWNAEVIYDVPEITGITLNASWVNDIPASGGTATKDNCSYNVMGLLDDGNTRNVTNLSNVNGSLTVPSSKDENRHIAGTLTLNAEYQNFTDSENVIAYQAGFVMDCDVEIIFNVTSSTNPTRIYYSGNCIDYFTIDDDSTQYEPTSRGYTFDTTGNHTVHYHLTGGTVGEQCFLNCLSISSVVIGTGVTSIDEGCFAGCTGLTSIDIPDSVTSLGYGCFLTCSSLSSITIGTGVTIIDRNTFEDCSSLTSIEIPDSVTSLGNACFADCNSLSSVVIGTGVTTLGDSCFISCTGLTSIEIPDSVTEMGIGCFHDCISLSSVVIGTGVTGIPQQCFQSCISLSSVTIPSGVTTLGTNGFENCTGLTSIDIPDSVTSLGSHCFDKCYSLTSITIPDSVTSLGSSCFARCRSLTSIDIPDSVTDLGGECFLSCTGLTSVTLPSGIKSLGDFANCSSLTSIEIPDSVTTLDINCFSGCTALTSIDIPSGVTRIGSSCFASCESLTSITIPSRVTDMGFDCFQYCRSLSSITCLPTTPPIAGSGIFSNTNNCPIYVPQRSVDEYKSAYEWRNYKDRIYGI